MSDLHYNVLLLAFIYIYTLTSALIHKHSSTFQQTQAHTHAHPEAHTQRKNAFKTPRTVAFAAITFSKAITKKKTPFVCVCVCLCVSLLRYFFYHWCCHSVTGCLYIIESRGTHTHTHTQSYTPSPHTHTHTKLQPLHTHTTHALTHARTHARMHAHTQISSPLIMLKCGRPER